MKMYIWENLEGSEPEKPDNSPRVECNLLATTDAEIWARNFCKIAKSCGYDYDFDKSWMMIWFANAILTGERHERLRAANAPISPEKPAEAAETPDKLARGFDLIGFPHVRIDDGGCAENTTGTQKIPPETPKLEGYLWAYKSKTGVFQAIKCGYGAALDREELDPGDVRIDLSKIIIPPEAIEIIAPPAPKKRVKGWLNLYPGNRTSILYNTRGMADQEATNSRTTRSACIEIDFEKGEGL